MKKLLYAEHHSLTKRHFGSKNTPTLEGKFGPYSLNNQHDRTELRRFALRIISELDKGAYWK